LPHDTKDFFLQDGPEYAYEFSKRNATYYSESFDSRIKSNLPIEPVMELSIIPSGVLIVPKKTGCLRSSFTAFQLGLVFSCYAP
jgi:hypothetical protein